MKTHQLIGLTTLDVFESFNIIPLQIEIKVGN
jgi:hypothetical protein